MPDNPYIVVPWSIDPSKSRKDHYFIASLFISLGGYLKRLNSGHEPQEHEMEILRSIDKLERILRHRFQKKDARNKLLKACCPKTKKDLDARRMRVVAVLVAYLVRGIEVVQISQLARESVLNDADWEETLETRRLITGLLVEKTLQLRATPVDERHIDPYVVLSSELISEAFGGKYALPFLSDEIISGCRELRRERASMPGRRRKAKHSQKDPVKEYVEKLPDYSPSEIAAELEKLG